MLPKVLCQTEKFTCMGCCGNSYGSKKEIEDTIKRNTVEFSHISTLAERKEFSKKAETLRPCGVCRAVVNKGRRKLCGLHPMQNDGEDYRDRICDKDFLCKAMKYYLRLWDDSTKQAFLDFVQEKNPDWYEYSMNMDQDKYFEEFIQKQHK